MTLDNHASPRVGNGGNLQDMKLFVAWNADVQQAAQAAAMSEKPEEVRRIARNVETGNRIWESWLLRIGGELVAYSGNEGQAIVPADRLEELAEIRRQYQQAVGDIGRVGVGVGVKLPEALMALKASHQRGGDRPVLYTDDVAREVHDQQEEQDLLQPITKAQFNASTPSAGEATKIQNGQLSPSAAQPSPQASASPQQAVVGPGGAMQPDNIVRLKQGVVSVLKQAQAMTPVLEQMKASNPDLYEVISGSVQAMIEMARALGMGQMTKAERPARAASSPSPSFEVAKRGQTMAQLKSEETAGEDHRPEETSSPPPIDAVAKEEVVAHHHLRLPPGSTKDSKVKVVHADGSTSWVSVRSGQILSEDNHAISSLNPGGR